MKATNAIREIRLVLATNPTFPKSRVCVITHMAAAIHGLKSYIPARTTTLRPVNPETT
jgi:hypothetical protein